MFMRNRLARKMAAEMRGATCAGTQTSKAPTLSGPSVTNHYSVAQSHFCAAQSHFCAAQTISMQHSRISMQQRWPLSATVNFTYELLMSFRIHLQAYFVYLVAAQFTTDLDSSHGHSIL